MHGQESRRRGRHGTGKQVFAGQLLQTLGSSFAALLSSSSMDLISIQCLTGACCIVDVLSDLNRKPTGRAAKPGACEGLDG